MADRLLFDFGVLRTATLLGESVIPVVYDMLDGFWGVMHQFLEEFALNDGVNESSCRCTFGGGSSSIEG